MVYEKEIKYLKEKYQNPKLKLLSSGAEAIILSDNEKVIKYRLSKDYRIAQIDVSLRKFRTKREVKVINSLNSIIDCPKIDSFDDFSIIMEYVSGEKISSMDIISNNTLVQIGISLAKIHEQGISHGDLTTSNMILQNEKIYFIDFGLSTFTIKIEDYAVDIHLLKRAMESKHFLNFPDNYNTILNSYIKHFSKSSEVLKRLELVEKRGRYQHK